MHQAGCAVGTRAGGTGTISRCTQLGHRAWGVASEILYSLDRPVLWWKVTVRHAKVRVDAKAAPNADSVAKAKTTAKAKAAAEANAG